MRDPQSRHDLPAFITQHPNRLLTRREMKALTGNLSDVTYWRWERARTFPRAVKLGPNKVAWRLADIEAWLESHRSTSEA